MGANKNSNEAIANSNNLESLVSKVNDKLFSFYLKTKKKETEFLSGLLKLATYRKVVLDV